MNAFARALGFAQGLAERAVTSVERDGDLTALRTPDLPLVWDANHLRVPGAPGLPAGALAEEAARRAVPSMVVVGDEAEARRLAPGFRTAGWRLVRHRYMVHRAPAGAPPAAPGAVCEVDRAAVEEVRRELLLAEPWGTPEVARQVLAFERRLGAAAAGDRWFAAPAEGEVAACCRLFSDGELGQIEDVGTVPVARRGGLARAVVAAALAAAYDAGLHLIFLTCDAEGWACDFYARLGFVPAGVVHNFQRG